MEIHFSSLRIFTKALCQETSSLLCQIIFLGKTIQEVDLLLKISLLKNSYLSDNQVEKMLTTLSYLQKRHAYALLGKEIYAKKKWYKRLFASYVHEGREVTCFYGTSYLQPLLAKVLEKK